MTEDRAREVLKPCPFCDAALIMRGGVNPYGRCQTEGCWASERRITIPLGDPEQVRQWNTRASPIPVAGKDEIERVRDCTICGGVYDEYLGFTMHENRCAALHHPNVGDKETR